MAARTQKRLQTRLRTACGAQELVERWNRRAALEESWRIRGGYLTAAARLPQDCGAKVEILLKSGERGAGLRADETDANPAQLLE